MLLGIVKMELAYSIGRLTEATSKALLDAETASCCGRLPLAQDAAEVRLVASLPLARKILASEARI